jgi:hypothetical protein
MKASRYFLLGKAFCNIAEEKKELIANIQIARRAFIAAWAKCWQGLLELSN